MNSKTSHVFEFATRHFTSTSRLTHFSSSPSRRNNRFLEYITLLVLFSCLLGSVNAFVILPNPDKEILRDYNNLTIIKDCSLYTNCEKCTKHVECGFCVKDNTCVNGGWNEPFTDSGLCKNDKWEYHFGQCLVTHKQALISLSSALFAVLLVSLFVCFCCCLCRCCRLSSNDKERTPLLGNESIATHHFRRASFYNYNRNRPFERRGRTVSSGTASSSMQYGRNWRNSDDYMYGYGGPSMLFNDHAQTPMDYTIGGQGNSTGTGEWKGWEKKREELLAKYRKNSEG